MNFRLKSLLGPLIWLLVGAIIGYSVCNLAQGPEHLGPSPKKLERRLKFLARKLDLTDSQREQVREIFEDSKEHLRAFRREHRPKFEALREDSLNKVKSVLNPEQLKKFEKLQARRQARMKKKRSKW